MDERIEVDEEAVIKALLSGGAAAARKAEQQGKSQTDAATNAQSEIAAKLGASEKRPGVDSTPLDIETPVVKTTVPAKPSFTPAKGAKLTK